MTTRLRISLHAVESIADEMVSEQLVQPACDGEQADRL